MAEDGPVRVRFRVVEPEEYRLYPVSDVMGAPTPSGEIVAHFFVHHASVPQVPVVHEVQADGTLGDPVPTTGEADDVAGTVDRRLQCGMVVSPRVARAIAAWLIRQADAVEGKGAETEGDVSAD